MKKISYLLIILILFNFICMIFLNGIVYANTQTDYSEMKVSDSMSLDDYKSMSEDGKTTISTNSGSIQRDISINDSDVGAVGSKCAGIISSLCGVVVNLLSNVTVDSGLYYVNSKYSAYESHLFTINSLVFGEYLLFNSKPYQKSTDLLTEDEIDSSDDTGDRDYYCKGTVNKSAGDIISSDSTLIDEQEFSNEFVTFTGFEDNSLSIDKLFPVDFNLNTKDGTKVDMSFYDDYIANKNNDKYEGLYVFKIFKKDGVKFDSDIIIDYGGSSNKKVFKSTFIDDNGIPRNIELDISENYLYSLLKNKKNGEACFYIVLDQSDSEYRTNSIKTAEDSILRTVSNSNIIKMIDNMKEKRCSFRKFNC